jgi:allantoinase
MIIKGGKVALPHAQDFQEFDIRIENESITEIGPELSEKKSHGRNHTIDAGGLLVLPGGIDPHVHFDDPGYTQREDFYHGSCAAASGGITTVIDMPDTSIPPVINRNNLLQKLGAIGEKAVVDFGLYGGVSAQSFDEGFPHYMRELADDVLGFKTYFISGMESFDRLNLFQFQSVLHEAKTLRRPVLLHAEDFEYVTAATPAAMRGGNTPFQYYSSRPEMAEMLASLSAAELAMETGANLHIVHIGTARVGEVLRTGGITGETGPQYLQFDVIDFEKIGSPLKCTPPVKGPGNREKLWKLLAEDAIEFVASDHAPCSAAEKSTGSIWSDYAGMPGCGLLLPYMFSEGYMKGRITLQKLLQVTSENAAKRYGLFERKGSIERGKDADFTLVDTGKNWIVRGEEFYSKGHITPFEGMVFEGRIVKTILRGKVIYSVDKGIEVQRGYGRLLKREGTSKKGQTDHSEQGLK